MFWSNLQAKTCNKYQGQKETGYQASYGAKFWKSAMKSEKNPQPPWSSATLIVKNPKMSSGNLWHPLVKWYQKPKEIIFGEGGPEILFEWAQENTKLMSRLVKDPQIFCQLKKTNYSILQWNREDMLQMLWMWTHNSDLLIVIFIRIKQIFLWQYCIYYIVMTYADRVPYFHI